MSVLGTFERGLISELGLSIGGRVSAFLAGRGGIGFVEIFA